MALDTGLRPATTEQPQIPFPDAASLANQQATLEGEQNSPEKIPVLLVVLPIPFFKERLTYKLHFYALHPGLLYLRYPQSERRPTASDVIILTVRTAELPDVVIGGAKIPVSRMGNSSVRFQMTSKNALRSTAATNKSSPAAIWDHAMTTSDLIVQAVVCDRDSVVSASKDADLTAVIAACRTIDGSPPITAVGVAKLVRWQPSSNDPSLSSTLAVIRAPVALPLENAAPR